MTLALIAGRGDLPALVAAACRVPPLVAQYEGTALSGLKADITFRLETLGTLLAVLSDRGVTQVCFAGGLERPVLDPSMIDARTVPMVPAFLEALGKGDDGALRVFLDVFRKAGFDLLGAHEIAPELAAPHGIYGTVQPDLGMQKDADIAAAHIRKLSPQDIGQACVVSAGQVIAMEDARGTDAMLSALAADAGGILYKGPKSGQTHKVDLPTVGPDTLQAVADAGLGALVVEQGTTLILHRPECIAVADRLGLGFWARSTS